MGNRHQHFRPFPGGPSGQVDSAVFGDHEVILRARYGDDIAAEIWQDARMPVSGFISEGGGHAGKGFAAAGHRCPGQIIQLSAGAADMAQTCAFRTDLSVEVNRDAVVDGDHVFL